MSKSKTTLKCCSICLTCADILPTVNKKAFIIGQLVPFMTGFNSTASDTWTMPQGGARGQNFGHLFSYFIGFIILHLKSMY